MCYREQGSRSLMRVHIIIRPSTCYILPTIHTNLFMILHLLLNAREWSGNVMLAVMHYDGCTNLICIRTFTCYILPLVPTSHSNFFVNLQVLLRGGEQRYCACCRA